MTAAPYPEMGVVLQAFKARFELEEPGITYDRVIIERAGPYEYMCRAWRPNEEEFFAYREVWDAEMSE